MVLALATGVGIAAACGLRAFLPLFALGLAARLSVIELKPGLDGLSSDPALVALGVATVLEILADKVPAVDHALDLVGTVLRPLAAGFGAYAALVDWPAPWGALVSVILGGGALLLHLAKAKLRLGSTAITWGQANPVLSVAEDLATAALLVAALLVPLLALALALLVVAVVVARRRGRRAPA